MYNRRPSQSHSQPNYEGYPVHATYSASSSGQGANLPHAWLDPQPLGPEGSGRRLTRQPSQGLQEAANLLEPIMRKHGGRSAPINVYATSPLTQKAYAQRQRAAYAEQQALEFSVGEFVTAQHYTHRDRTYSPAKVGQIVKIQQDPVLLTNVFTIAFVDEYTKKKSQVEYSVGKGDRIALFEGDAQALVDLHSNRFDTAPNMGQAHGWLSAALATPVVHGEIHSPKRCH